ncbi:hypothetical protein GCM10017771_93230 [Streptomyces capitiformicae]|uniref:Uncharacterized protein n=1 Tax=Streptomyces capitiformicae TaxID=2014920 RepID=A0A918ZUM2_9ACTN|nr:hypothetical protein GCM10017771_93230 [Streptomyces capitiformicae]
MDITPHLASRHRRQLGREQTRPLAQPHPGVNEQAREQSVALAVPSPPRRIRAGVRQLAPRPAFRHNRQSTNCTMRSGSSSSSTSYSALTRTRFGPCGAITVSNVTRSVAVLKTLTL